MNATKAVKRDELQKELDDYGIYLEDLRGFLFKKDWRRLSANTDLAYSTIQDLASGKTRRPQERTVRKLIKACGYRIAIVPENMPTIAGEVRFRKNKK